MKREDLEKKEFSETVLDWAAETVSPSLAGHISHAPSQYDNTCRALAIHWLDTARQRDKMRSERDANALLAQQERLRAEAAERGERCLAGLLKAREQRHEETQADIRVLASRAEAAEKERDELKAEVLIQNLQLAQAGQVVAAAERSLVVAHQLHTDAWEAQACKLECSRREVARLKALADKVLNSICCTVVEGCEFMTAVQVYDSVAKDCAEALKALESAPSTEDSEA